MALDKMKLNALKSRAHNLSPVVMIGQAGLTKAVLLELDTALATHELIKIDIAVSDRQERLQIAKEASKATGSLFVQLIGKRLTLYRKQPES